LLYKLELSNSAKKDLNKISEYLENYLTYRNKVIEKIDKDIENLKVMPRIHKTVIFVKDKSGEYRRIVSGKYIIIYKIINEEITVLRVFNQKENYLNLNKFILREKSQKYFLIKCKEKGII